MRDPRNQPPYMSSCRRARGAPATAPNIEALARQASDRFRFVGLSLQERGVDASLKKLGIEFPSYYDASEQPVKSLHLNSTPQLVVISPQGTVIRNWIGAWNDATRRDVEAFFHVRLPGLAPLPTK